MQQVSTARVDLTVSAALARPRPCNSREERSNRPAELTYSVSMQLAMGSFTSRFISEGLLKIWLALMGIFDQLGELQRLV